MKTATLLPRESLATMLHNDIRTIESVGPTSPAGRCGHESPGRERVAERGRERGRARGKSREIDLFIITISNVTTTFRFSVILPVLPPSCFLAVRPLARNFCYTHVWQVVKTLRRGGEMATVDLLCTTWVIPLIDTRSVGAFQLLYRTESLSVFWTM